MEQFSYDDGIVRLFATATIVWGLLATLGGVIVATFLVLPWLTGGLPWFAFGRLRPVHTNAAIFAFAGNAIFAAIYYSTQRLCKARMWSYMLSRLHFWGWQAIIVAAAVSLPLGITQGKEFAELQWPIDIAIAVLWLFVFGGNFFMTLRRRRERHLYVTLWFYIATIVTVGLLHVVNNLVLPIDRWHSYSLYAGVQDALMQWWYGHGAVQFMLTMPFLGLMYYFLPKAADRPVFSYRLSIIHFWSLVFLFIWAGPHHLHYTSLPDWVSTLGMLFGLMLWMPSWAGVVNGLLTLRGAWHTVTSDPVLKFFAIGVAFYGLATLESPLLAIKSVDALSHYTDWEIAHVHAAALGWNGFMTFGMLYWLLPRLYQTPIWSPKLVNVHFWLGIVGILLYIIPTYAAGVIQGLMWRAIDAETGQLTYPDFIQTTLKIVPLWWVRILGGSVYFIGLCLLAVNTLMTWLRRPAKYDVPIHQAPRLSKSYKDNLVQPASDLAAVPVLEFGKKLDVWSKLGWHRRWERLPGRFVLLATLAIALAAVVEVVPVFLIRGNVPTLATVQPYTPLELAGRHIYISEGCHNCHSQQVRRLIADTKRYGEYSKPGEFIYDRPFQWGSRRIGPDLAREGGKQSSFWHWTHLEDPAREVEGSVMPSFEHLLHQDLNFAAIGPLVKTAHQLGAPYEAELEEYEAMAHSQAEVITADIVKQGGPAAVYDKQAIALIAYLQRLGTDISRAPAAAEVAPADPTADGGVAPAVE